VFGTKTHPACGSQPSSVHTLPSPQTVGPPARHTPALHASPVVQAFPSSQAAVLSVCTHDPVWTSQLSSVQALPSLHVTGVKTHPVCVSQLSIVQGFSSSHTVGDPGTHAPSPQVSPDVQASPSSHAPVLFVKTHAPSAGLHASSVQAFPSSHTVATPG